MNKFKEILENMVKATLITATVIGLIAVILLFKFHISRYPIIINFYPQERILLVFFLVLFLLVLRFRMKYLKWVTLIALILACINLFGFDIILSLFYKYTSCLN